MKPMKCTLSLEINPTFHGRMLRLEFAPHQLIRAGVVRWNAEKIGEVESLLKYMEKTTQAENALVVVPSLNKKNASHLYEWIVIDHYHEFKRIRFCGIGGTYVEMLEIIAAARRAVRIAIRQFRKKNLWKEWHDAPRTDHVSKVKE